MVFALIVVRAALVVCALWIAGAPATAAADDLERGYAAKIRAYGAAGGSSRPDGYLYAVDIAAIMRFAIATSDPTLYTHVRDVAVTRFIIAGSADPEASDYVAWRVKNGEKIDASGTTEALDIGGALLAGAKKFDRSEDRAIGQRILRAYGRHQTVDLGVWMIRNYYNLVTRAYATNSYLVDYDPDVLANAGHALSDSYLTDLAMKSYKLMDHTVAPSGLLYDVVQPELATIYPVQAQLVYFSPNAVAQPANACSVARRIARGRPEIAKRILRFGASRARSLVLAYDIRSGAALDKRSAGTPALACFARLADDVRDFDARRELEGVFRDNAKTQLAQGPLDAVLAVDVDLAIRRVADGFAL